MTTMIHLIRSTLAWGPALALALVLALPTMAAAAARCPADLNGSGAVDTVDLGILLAAWGTSHRGADFNRDGAVGCFDLEYLLGNFGPCPCQGDINGDGVVDTLDLGSLLAAWGTVCTADLDQNGTVDGNDVDALLCLWGTPGPLGDLNGDRTINSADLAIVLAAQGTNCAADLDRDGKVGQGDLNILTGAWGRCR